MVGLSILKVVCYQFNMDNVSNLPLDPHDMLKFYFGEKYVVLSLTDHATQYAVGEVNAVELAYLSRILEIISSDKITGRI